MALNEKDGHVGTVLRAHEMIHEALGFRRMNYVINNPYKSSSKKPSQLANQLGSVFGALIIVFIVWFLFQGF